MLAIDLFKQVKDTRGHTIGDEVLMMLCERIKQVLHSTLANTPLLAGNKKISITACFGVTNNFNRKRIALDLLSLEAE